MNDSEINPGTSDDENSTVKFGESVVSLEEQTILPFSDDFKPANRTTRWSIN